MIQHSSKGNTESFLISEGYNWTLTQANFKNSFDIVDPRIEIPKNFPKPKEVFIIKKPFNHFPTHLEVKDLLKAENPLAVPGDAAAMWFLAQVASGNSAEAVYLRQLLTSAAMAFGNSFDYTKGIPYIVNHNSQNLGLIAGNSMNKDWNMSWNVIGHVME